MIETIKQHRLWVIWIGAAAVIGWYWATDPNHGAETMGRLQWMAWSIVALAPTYLARKSLMPGDSRGLLKEAREGSIPSGLVWLGMAFLTGMLFLGFASITKGADMATLVAQAGLPSRAEVYIWELKKEKTAYWPNMSDPATLGSQVEQETCPSLKAKGCWSPQAELKTDRENGIGLGQVTVTARFDNFAAARGLDVTLRDWAWADRYDSRRQLRTLILMDRGAYRRLEFIPTERERLAMMYAAYNGGLGGVLSDRRVCAAVAGCNPDRWFDHVEHQSLKAKVVAPGYGQSFFQINRGYVRNIMLVRRPRYEPLLGVV